MSLNIRYIRDCINGSTANTGNHWIEIKAINITSGIETNVAQGKTISGNDTVTNPSYVVDGDTSTLANYTSMPAGNKYIQIDLGYIRPVSYIHVWHYYGDDRIYKMHTITVSSDGVEWFTIQPPESHVKESPSGAKYWLYPNLTSLASDSIATDEDVKEILSSINSTNGKRNLGLHTMSILEESVITANFINAIKSEINSKYSVAWTQTLTDADGISQLQDFKELATKSIEISTNVATCLNNCSSSCTFACSAICYSTCGGGCGGTCTATCGGTCSGGCAGVCAGGCASACGGGCVARCASGSYGGGINICAGTCDQRCCMACGATACYHACGSGCYSTCGSGCLHACGSGCVSGCIANCQLSCDSTCVSSCTNTCTATCVLNCQSSCRSTCVSSCISTCTTTCISASM